MRRSAPAQHGAGEAGGLVAGGGKRGEGRNAGLELAVEGPIEHVLAGRELLCVKIKLPAAEFLPQEDQRFFAVRFVQEGRDLLHEIIAGSAVDAPVGRKLLARAEDLLDDDIGRALRRVGGTFDGVEPRPERAAIARRGRSAPSTWSMRTAVDQTLRIKPEIERVGGLEDLLVLDF